MAIIRKDKPAPNPTLEALIADRLPGLIQKKIDYELHRALREIFINVPEDPMPELEVDLRMEYVRNTLDPAYQELSSRFHDDLTKGHYSEPGPFLLSRAMKLEFREVARRHIIAQLKREAFGE